MSCALPGEQCPPANGPTGTAISPRNGRMPRPVEAMRPASAEFYRARGGDPWLRSLILCAQGSSYAPKLDCFISSSGGDPLDQIHLFVDGFGAYGECV